MRDTTFVMWYYSITTVHSFDITGNKRKRQLHFRRLGLANINTTIFRLHNLNARSTSQSIGFYSLQGIRCEYGRWEKLGCAGKRRQGRRLCGCVDRRRRTTKLGVERSPELCTNDSRKLHHYMLIGVENTIYRILFYFCVI